MKNTILLIAMLLTARLCGAQNTLNGSISGNDNKEPVEAAYVKLSNGSNHYQTYSDADGKFSILNVANGDYYISITHIGHEVLVKKMTITKNVNEVFYLIPDYKFMDAAIITSIRARNTTPTTYTNLNKETIEGLDQGKDFPFLLNTTPSTVISSDAGNGVGYTGIRIRGIDPTRVNVTINGIPLNDGESQGTYWVDLPDLASSTQSVQIQRGIGTSTNGAASFGASVNVRTTDIPDKKYTSARIGMGSFNTLRSTIAFGSGKLKNNWAFQLRGSVIGSDGYIDRATSDLKSLNLVAAKYAKKSVFKANILLGTERTYQAWWGIPEPKFNGDRAGTTRYINQLWIGGDELENLQNSNGKTYNYYTYENEVDQYTQNHYQFFFDHKISQNLKLNTAAYLTTGNGYFEQFKAGETLADYGLPIEIINGDTFAEADVVRRRWLQNTLSGALASLTYQKRKIDVVVGGAYSLYQGRHFGEAVATEFTDYEAMNAIYYDNDATKSDANVYTKIKYKWQNFIPYLDVQMRTINYQFEGLDNQLNFGDQKVDYLFINPKVGLTYLHKNKTFYAVYAQGNREPVRDDFRNNKPTDWPEHESLNNVEIGFRYSKGRKRIGINLYDMNYTNQLVLTGAVNDVGEAIRTNVEESFRRGVEVELQFPLAKRLQLGGNLTLSQNKIQAFTEEVGEWDGAYEIQEFEHSNTDISFSPNIIGALMASYKVNKNWTLDAFGKYVGAQYLDNTQNEGRKLDAFTNVDASITYTNSEIKGMQKMSVGFYLNNALNSFYAPNGYTFSGFLNGKREDFNYLYPMAGRNVMVKFSVTI